MSAGTTVPLIESRLHPAPPRSDDVSRDDIVAAMPGAHGGPRLTLVVAPPGWGKSSVLAHWLAATEGLAIAYVALDERDADGRRALCYLGEAIRRAVPGLDESDMPEASASLWIDEALPVVVRGVIETGCRLTVVLDDLHLVEGPGFPSVVAALVDELPAGCHVVIAGREAPPFQVGRLRASRELLEIGPSQLRFGADEANELLSDAFGVELEPDDLQRLIERTEGWPSGLSLAGISLVGQTQQSKVVETFGGSAGYVGDYLAEEVLQNVDDRLRSFLLATAVLPRFCPPLADAVTQGVDGDARIDELTSRNMFIVTMDPVGPWVRYHHLFREQLLALSAEDERQEHHHRAAAWWREHARTPEAIDHLIAAGDTFGAAELIDEIAWYELGRGRAATLVRWIERLDSAALRAFPLLYVVAGTAADELGDVAAGRNWFDRLDGEDIELDERQRHAVDVERCWIFINSGDLTSAVEVGGRILEGADRFGAHSDDPTDMGVDLAQICLNAGTALVFAGELDRAIETFDRLWNAPSTDGRALAATRGFTALVNWMLGNDEEFRAAAAESLQIWERLETSDSIYALPTLLSTVLVDPSGCDQRVVDRLTALTELVRTPYATAFTRYGEVAVLAARGEHETAAQAIAEIRDELQGVDRSEFLDQLLETAEAGLERSEASTPDPGSLTDREIQVLRALTGPLTQREIARELYLSFNTVKSYSRTAFRKLGVNSRTDAVRRCRDLGVF